MSKRITNLQNVVYCNLQNFVSYAPKKGLPRRGGGGCCGGDFFWKRGGGGGSSDADVRPFWSKNFKFFKIYGVSAGRGRDGGKVSADNFQTRGEGVSFSSFCADILYGRPLTHVDECTIITTSYILQCYDYGGWQVGKQSESEQMNFESPKKQDVEPNLNPKP